MKRINWKVRMKNPLFLFQVVCAVCLPVLAYMGLRVEELTTWGKLGSLLWNAISNPYIVGMMAVSAFNAITDPTTRGAFDSMDALTYEEPKRKN